LVWMTMYPRIHLCTSHVSSIRPVRGIGRAGGCSIGWTRRPHATERHRPQGRRGPGLRRDHDLRGPRAGQRAAAASCPARKRHDATGRCRHMADAGILRRAWRLAGPDALQPEAVGGRAVAVYGARGTHSARRAGGRPHPDQGDRASGGSRIGRCERHDDCESRNGIHVDSSCNFISET